MHGKNGSAGKGKGAGGTSKTDGSGSGGGEAQATGDRESSDGEAGPFTAENLKGRIDPKGRISVTTFRGLPKPGQVTAELREALQRARDDAQAPLETEEIPRRYREGIREYFDDLGRAK